jgi:small GTP-binding protein
MSGDEINYNKLYKMIIIGDSNVGKSNMLYVYINGKYGETDELKSTIGIEYYSKIYKWGKDIVKYQFWDTAGQEKYRSICKFYYINVNSIILVYDITCQKSFDNLPKWLDEIDTNCIVKDDVKVKILLVGNKIDDDNLRQVPYEKGKEFAEQHGFDFIETSIRSSSLNKCLDEFVYTVYKENNHHIPERDDEVIKLQEKVEENTGCFC